MTLNYAYHTLYSLILTITILLTLPWWSWRYFTTPKYRGTIKQRLGFMTSKRDLAKPCIWLHAVSVGETMAARSLAIRLLETFPDHELVVSTVTKTGQEVARQHISLAKDFFYLPIDLKICIHPVVNAIRPSFVVIMETELWPNLYRILAKHDIPVIVVNGRISLRSFKRYFALRWLMRHILADGQQFLMQSEADAQRLMAMGAVPQRVKVVGNIKYDQAMRPPDPVQMEILTHRLPVPEQPVWVAASTHPGEEAILLAVFLRCLAHPVALRLILVPRHPERTQAVMELLAQKGVSFQRFSQTHGEWHAPILLVDEIGWLASLYRWASFVFIGGTLVPHGGQNMLEAAAWGVPVLFGPHTFNFPEIATQMIHAGAAVEINGPEALFEQAMALLTDQERHLRMSQASRRVIPANLGALERTITVIRHVVDLKNQ